MRRIIAAAVAAIAFLTVSAGAKTPQEVRAIDAVPKGYKVVNSGASLDELKRQTKATLVFTYMNDESILFSAGVDAKGKVQFTLASARLYAPRLQAARWVTLSGSGDTSGLLDGYSFVPKQTLSLVENIAAVEGKKSYARIVAQDSARGTVYELRHLVKDSDGYREKMFVVLREPSGTWRYAGDFDGSSVYMRENPSLVRAQARFTSSTTSAIDLTLTTTTGREIEETRYTGSLPFSYPRSTRLYTTIKSGDTLSQIAAAHLCLDRKMSSYEKQLLKDTVKDILKLNPGLDAESLKPGKQLNLPPLEGC